MRHDSDGALLTALVAQLDKSLESVLDGDELTHLLRLRDIAVTDVDGARLLFLCANDENEVVLRELARSNLLLHGVASNVNIDVHTLLAEQSLELEDIVVCRRHDGDDEDLAGRKPERPLSGKVLGQDGEEALE